MKTEKRLAVFLTAMLVSFFWVALAASFYLELRGSNKELLATREVLEKIKVDLGDAEEELLRAKEDNLVLKLVAVAFLKEREDTIPIKKEALVQLFNCCDGKLRQQDFFVGK